MKKIIVAALLTTAALAGCHHKSADTTPANGSGSGAMGGAGYGGMGSGSNMGTGSGSGMAPAGGM